MNRRGKRRKAANLRVIFVASIFGLMLATALVMAPVALLFARWELFRENPLPPIFLLFTFSLITGTFLSGFVSKRILKPITKIGNAAQAVAKGDFTVRLDGGSGVNEIEDIYQSFNTMVEELGSIETLRNDFVANVSHEFKNPLASIEGCATLLQDETTAPAERLEYTQMILDSTHQLSTLTGNILKLSKLESSGLPLEMAAFRLDEQVRQAVLLLEKGWAAKQLVMEVDLDDARYMGNEDLLLQVWLNLLGNAIKFTPEKGRVQVALYKTSGGVSVQVEDTGPGISPQAQRHIFEKFYQADPARKAQGNGLGLALAQSIVRQHGGSIEVKSREGKGSVFTVRLPGTTLH